MVVPAGYTYSVITCCPGYGVAGWGAYVGAAVVYVVATGYAVAAAVYVGVVL